MIPGMRGMNPRQMKHAMKRMGIKMDEVQGVTEVLIKTPDEVYVIKKPEVLIIEAQGQKMFQVVGEYEVVSPSEVETTGAGPGGEGEDGVRIPEEDIKLVAQQAGVSEEEALEALREANGEPAEAIIRLMSRKK